MTVKEIVEKLDLEVLSGETELSREVKHGYVSDLMSDVIAHAQKGDIWVTLQIHVNIVAVAVMKELSGILLIGGRKPETTTLTKAKAENMPILCCPLTAFETVGRLYTAGVTGQEDA